MLPLPTITDLLMVVRLLHSWLELRNLLKTPEDFFWVFKLNLSKNIYIYIYIKIPTDKATAYLIFFLHSSTLF